MNLIEGSIQDGQFVCELNKGFPLSGPEGPITLGFRAEDAEIVSEGGQLKGLVYAMELLGDATLITLRIGGSLVCVKMPKDFRATMGQELAVFLKPAACHLFEKDSGHRLNQS
jgi:multiple sugar transport system ATP-binding protein